MKRTAIASAVLAAGAVLAIPTPAHAGLADNVSHYSPDAGYDAPIVYADRYGRVYSIGEGYGVGNVAQIYVAAGTEVSCSTNGVTFHVWYDATGWHNSAGNATCVNGLD
jgi:hypothetical protein